MRHAPIGERGAAGEIDHVLHVLRPHHAAVVDAHIHEQLVELHVLLRERVQQVVKPEARDGEHRLAVELGVVEAVEKMDAAGPRGGNAGAKAARPLGVGASVEGGCFLVPHLDEADAVAADSQRLDYAVDAVAWETENGVDAPIEQRFDQHVRCGR